ncbi:MAG TPA: hypothetical protein VNS34_03615 [Rhizobiaceae bacterium]|nr:hypothetical protein [Rhizobiaceae bacterium]
MQDRYRRLEGADQLAIFGEPAVRGRFSRLMGALGILLRRFFGRPNYS